MLPGETFVARDAEGVTAEAARRFVACARGAIEARGRFDVALAGGRTPQALYERLAAPPLVHAIDWPRASFFFGDERHVPAGDARSNARMATEALFARVPAIRPGAVHRVDTTLPLEQAALAYERELATLAASQADVQADPRQIRSTLPASRPPRFDLVLLGMGAEGHTASLFPHQATLAETSRLAVAARVPPEPHERVTVTLPVLNGARLVLVLVTGADKAAVLRVVRAAPAEAGPLADEHPILHVRPGNGAMAWLLDEAAAR